MVRFLFLKDVTRSTGKIIRHNITGKYNSLESLFIKIKTQQGKFRNRIEKKLVSNKWKLQSQTLTIRVPVYHQRDSNSILIYYIEMTLDHIVSLQVIDDL